MPETRKTKHTNVGKDEQQAELIHFGMKCNVKWHNHFEKVWAVNIYLLYNSHFTLRSFTQRNKSQYP